jgi:hypothetical protein
MPYKVQFVGLVCFYREKGSRLALLPDGRTPDAGIDPHYGSIVIHDDWIEGSTGWENVNRDDEEVFPLEPCEVIIEGADATGPLDVSEHDHKLPQLRQIDPNFEIDPQRAVTIARVRIRQGTLSAHRIPEGAAVVSQLVVPHDGGVTITIKPDDGSPERSIRTKPGAEIAITNMARGSYKEADRRNDHFKIYEKLSVRPVSLREPDESVASGLSELQSGNPLFHGRGSIGLYINCSNTGCCD